MVISLLLNYLWGEYNRSLTTHINRYTTSKGKKITTTIFGRLLLVILMGDFYQFAPVLEKAFYDKAVGEKKLQGKSL